MLNTDDSTGGKQLHNEFKGITSLGYHYAAFIVLASSDTEGEPTSLRFQFPQRNPKVCLMHLDGTLIT